MSVINLTSQNFESEVNTSEKPVLIDFWAEWCGPCKMMGPVVEELSNENSETVKVCKVNVDEAQDLAMKFNIMSIPTFVVIQNGNVKATSVGVQSKEQLLNLIH